MLVVALAFVLALCMPVALARQVECSWHLDHEHLHQTWKSFCKAEQRDIGRSIKGELQKYYACQGSGQNVGDVNVLGSGIYEQGERNRITTPHYIAERLTSSSFPTAAPCRSKNRGWAPGSMCGGDHVFATCPCQGTAADGDCVVPAGKTCHGQLYSDSCSVNYGADIPLWVEVFHSPKALYFQDGVFVGHRNVSE